MVFSKLRAWVADRFGWGPIKEVLLDRRVAKGAWYFGDGATLMLLLAVLVVTGLTLALTYSPTPEHAYESVEHITLRQTAGWLVRALHYWSAGFMVVMLFFHLFRQVLLGGYKAPREGTWIWGVVLFFLVLSMSFTGYVLRWDERGVHALRIPLYIFSYVPWVGDELVLLVQGGPEIGARSLTRVYAIHVLLVPLLIAGAVAFHLYLVIFQGTTSPTERRRPVGTAEEQRRIYNEDKESEDRGEKFHPSTTAKSGTMAFVVFSIVVALAVLVGPAKLYPPANLVERSFPVEEWWWWWYSALAALLPPKIAPAFHVIFPVFLFILLVSLPFLDRGPARGIRNRPIASGVVIVCILGLLVLSDLRRRSPWTGWPQAGPPTLPENIQLTDRVERGGVLFAEFGCYSCHPIAGRGPKVGTDFAQNKGLWSRAEIRNFILNPPEHVPMPSYAGRLTGDELEALVEFCHAAQTFPRAHGKSSREE